MGLLAAVALAAPASAADRYSLAGGCYAVKAAGATHGPVRMQATRLGEYLLYTKDARFLGERFEAVAEPSPSAEWRVEGDTLTNVGSGARVDGVTFEQADGCAVYPELETNTTGTPNPARYPFARTQGLIDAHLHGMALPVFGGIHCGRPWHPYGAPYALRDCPDHEPNGEAAVVENIASYGSPVGTHDTNGWPAFTGWPNHQSLTHEQVYWKWLERAWRGGLRLYVNLFVENGVLCEINPISHRQCDEMQNVRTQMRNLRAMVDYIDAQSGGPGEGFLRIVTDPFQARRVINEGKLAVVMGIEISRLFGCTETNDAPECDRARIDREMDEMYAAGVRQMQLINKFDNALSGVAGDSGVTGVITNSGNRYETGHYLAMQTCTGPNAEHDHDKPQETLPGTQETDPLVGATLRAFLGHDTVPVYGPAPHCNLRGLTDLGAYVIRRMIDKGMIFDPDHLSILARRQAMDLIEAHSYGGLISSHGWSSPETYARIARMGGLVTPHEGGGPAFVKAWRETKAMANRSFFYGTGYSTDMNGFSSQPGPRADNKDPVTYPFTSLDGEVKLDRQKSGAKTFDINADGVAHYGMYPDVIEDVRRAGGPEVVADLLRGAEAYLQMWERADGVPFGACQSDREHLTRRGLGRLRIGDDYERALRRAGQPDVRGARRWTYCVRGTRNRGARVHVGLDAGGRVALIASTARSVGARARVPRGTRSLARDLRVRPAGGRAFVYLVRGDRVRAAGVAATSSPRRLRSDLRLAGLR